MSEILINTKVLVKNNEIADSNRKLLKDRGILTINLMSSPGSGKTSIVEKTIEQLKGKVKVAVIEGDIQTDLDTQRILKYGIPAIQINTGRSCHLDARMIQLTLPWIFEQGRTDLVIIENVGNMVCPAGYDLGEDVKVAVMSVTEGDDKPLKYPSLFCVSQYLLINKIDLLAYTNFNMEKARRNALTINPKLKIIVTSCTNGTGIKEWVESILKDKFL
ncbi:MAG TPA: hydrogenase nickel incorporation protein HypB [Candidatus Wunengus sp. YC63]|uniref:hydrogenase nickel incorporation protein HypB n=1 Tax=unclassified Candidatus Wunengus TaxID=3367695 RepID=UPI004028FC97